MDTWARERTERRQAALISAIRFHTNDDEATLVDVLETAEAFDAWLARSADH